MCRIYIIPSSKRLHNELENHHAINGEIHYRPIDDCGVFVYPLMTGPIEEDPSLGRKSGSAKGDSRSYDCSNYTAWGLRQDQWYMF